MRLKMIFKKAAVLCACLLLAASAFLPRQVYASDQDSGTSLSRLKDARIGVQTGTNFDEMVKEKMPDVTVVYLNTKADLVVVLLMVLFYIVFGKVSISGIAVAVIGFTLTFGASVFSLMKMGVGTIDRGQYEAAYALGHSNRRTFFRIILPQAIPHILPAYQGEIVGLSWMRAASLESINRLRPNAFQSLVLGRSRFL